MNDQGTYDKWVAEAFVRFTCPECSLILGHPLYLKPPLCPVCKTVVMQRTDDQ